MIILRLISETPKWIVMIRLKHPALHLLLTLSIVSACSKKVPDYRSFPKIDAHVHINNTDPSLMAFMADHNFSALTICTGSDSREDIDEQWGYGMAMKRKYPEHVAVATTFSMEHFETANWESEVMNQLRRDFHAGAIAVKVWKDIGMTFRDSLGNFIMIDDPRFDPIMNLMAMERKTLVAHIAEPRNCWLPLDEMSVNNDRRYFKSNPQYHMYLHPEYPSHEQLMAARDHLLEKNPTLRVVGAHLGSLEWDVKILGERLDRFPNFAVDMAARICHFQVQDRDKVRAFFIQYQDRLLYGTDAGFDPESAMAEKLAELDEVWKSDWRYFTTDETLTSPDVNQPFRGLALPVEVVKKIYYENAKRWIPGIPPLPES
jgi:hypothetical protein